MGASSSLAHNEQRINFASMTKEAKPLALSSRRVHKGIEKQLDDERKRARTLMKILCLGTSCSGKSTILKQMRILHQDGFVNDEKDIYRDSFLYTFVLSARELLSRVPESDFNSKSLEVHAAISQLSNMKARLIKGEAAVLTNVIKYFQAWEGEELISKYGLGQHCGTFLNYFLDRMQDVSSYDDFLPNTADILRIRVQTTGVVFTNFRYKKANFCMVDVGGQKTERRKWIHLFDDVKAIFFVVDLSNFDDMKESLGVFQDICSTTALKEANLIMFFNKTDIFRQKNNLWELAKQFPDFIEILCTHKEAGLFIKRKFEEEFKKFHENGLIYSFFTCATDTNNIEKTFSACSDIILKRSLAAAGLY